MHMHKKNDLKKRNKPKYWQVLEFMDFDFCLYALLHFQIACSKDFCKTPTWFVKEKIWVFLIECLDKLIDLKVLQRVFLPHSRFWKDEFLKGQDSKGILSSVERNNFSISRYKNKNWVSRKQGSLPVIACRIYFCL